MIANMGDAPVRVCTLYDYQRPGLHTRVVYA
jgi:hypothetical protein